MSHLLMGHLRNAIVQIGQIGSAGRSQARDLPSTDTKIHEIPIDIMPSANGSIFGDDADFTASFTVDNIPRHFVGTFQKAEKSWGSTNAKIEYENVDDLTGARTLRVTIGKQDVMMEIANGPKISGPLDNPFDPVSKAQGAGTWTVNLEPPKEV
ncbi:hypothetical protein NM208_g9747 [Fusarium decemcellulare]|uniref:Uncharacterized protein n=1 Tax=Fusarium decemcellulare TaxID=57161 RepID=A0ACC1S0G4_9HYPO|nr:hypothetical protein NM208_g9747 [Fusarium decemcellulare]